MSIDNEVLSYFFTNESLSLKPLVFSVEIKLTEFKFKLYEEDNSNVDSNFFFTFSQQMNRIKILISI